MKSHYHHLSYLHTQTYEEGMCVLLKPLQNKKGQKNLGYPQKSSLFPYKRSAFFAGTPNFFGPSYFEVALAINVHQIIQFFKKIKESN